MTYQDQQIQKLVHDLEMAVIKLSEAPSLSRSQDLAKARHNLMKFIKDAHNANQ